jgi:hypothetical protein
MSAFSLRYAKTADRPAAEGWIFDDDGSLVDLSAYTLVLKVGNPGSAALLTKSSGITGAAGAGVEPTGTPNVVITWSAGELAITPGTYTAQLTATASSLDRVYMGTITILDVVT